MVNDIIFCNPPHELSKFQTIGGKSCVSLHSQTALLIQASHANNAMATTTVVLGSNARAIHAGWARQSRLDPVSNHSAYNALGSSPNTTMCGLSAFDNEYIARNK